jgi:hypothetical protein
MSSIKQLSLWLAVVVLGTLTGAVMYSGYSAYSKSPAIQVDSREIDFGALPSGAKITKAFQVTNAGQSNLIIEKLRSGCGCIELEMKNNTIPPGKSEPIYVTLDPSEYGQKTGIMLETNDTKNRSFYLVVKASPVMSAVVEPAVIDFGLIENTEKLPISKSVEVLQNPDYFSETALNDFTVEASNSFLQIDDSHSSADGVRSLTLTLPKETPAGDIFTELYLKENTRTTAIRVLGYVRGDYLALPQMLIIGPVSQKDKAVSKTVTITSRRQNESEQKPAFKIESLFLSESLQDLLILDLQTYTDRFELSATMCPAQYRGIWSIRKVYGYVKIRCSSHVASEQEIIVPVMVSLKVPKVRDMPETF